jgi:hypothetical protein
MEDDYVRGVDMPKLSMNFENHYVVVDYEE